MTSYSIDPRRLAAYDRAFDSACAASRSANAAVSDLHQTRGVLVREIERKAGGEIRGRDGDFLIKAQQKGLATATEVASIRAIDTELQRAREHASVTDEHVRRLNDPTYRVRTFAGRRT